MAERKVNGMTAVVVGATRGIGLQWVSALLQQGNKVVATARSLEAANGLQDLAVTYGDKLAFTEVDISSPGSIAGWAGDLISKISHADLVVVNAGVSLEQPSSGIADMSPQVLTDILAVNTTGPLLVTQQLLKQGVIGGSSPTTLLYTSSRAGSIGSGINSGMLLYGYRASKVALNMLVKVSSVELQQHNVTSVLMHPGFVDTDMSRGAVPDQAVAKAMGVISVDESVARQLKVLQDTTRDLNGKFYSYTGEDLPW